jgi:hypothetical protein
MVRQVSQDEFYADEPSFYEASQPAVDVPSDDFYSDSAADSVLDQQRESALPVVSESSQVSSPISIATDPVAGSGASDVVSLGGQDYSLYAPPDPNQMTWSAQVVQNKDMSPLAQDRLEQSSGGTFFAKLVRAGVPIAMAAAVGNAFAPLLSGVTGASGLSGIQGAALSAAGKSALGNAVISAAQGADFGQILKAAAQGAVTGGAGAAIASTFAPALQEALIDAGIPSSMAKAASVAAISAGQAAVTGQDPLQAAFIAGIGNYAQLEGNKLINDFAEKSGISTEVAKQLVGPAGAAIASQIVGGDALRAAVNQLVNQNYDQIVKYGENKFTELFPEAAQSIKDFKGKIYSYVQQGKDALGNVVSNFGQPSTGGLQEVTVSATRLPDTPANLIQQPSGPSSAAVTPEPAGALPQTIEPPAPLETVDVTAQKVPETPVALTALERPQEPTSPLATVTEPVEAAPPQQPLEEVQVTAQKQPEVPVLASSGALPAVVEEPTSPLEEVAVTAQKEPEVPANIIPVGNLPTVSPDGLEEVAVTAQREPQKEPEVPVNAIPVGNLPTVGSDGMEEVAVTGSRYTPPPINLALNDFKPTVEQPDVSFEPPFNLNIETGKTGGLGTAYPSLAASQGSGFLDSSDAFLMGKKKMAQGSLLSPLQQLYSSLDPSLASVIAQRVSDNYFDQGRDTSSTQTPPRGFGEESYPAYVGFPTGGSVSANDILSSLKGLSDLDFKSQLIGDDGRSSAGFVSSDPEFLRYYQSPKARKEIIKKLVNISQAISPHWASIYSGGLGHPGEAGMAKGGLPSKYAEAAPEGHNPEFITGLTGYYAQGGGTGQSDDIPAMLHDGDYVMDADTVAAFGDGSSKAGAQVLDGLRKQVPYRNVKQGKAVPAKIADGEYVFPADFVTALGQGDNKRGAKMLDAMRERLRAHKRSAPTSKIPPKAKSPMDYMRGKG